MKRHTAPALIVALLVGLTLHAQEVTGAPAAAEGPAVSWDAWVGLAGALVGAVIGFAAAAFAVWLAHRETRRQHTEAIHLARRTIVAEVAVNQENFSADWRWVYEAHEPSDVAPVNRAGMYPAPVVVAAAWESQIGLVPEAFSQQEALDLHRFYASAHSAVAVRQTIQHLYVNDTAQQSRNEAFDIYRMHAERVVGYVTPDPHASTAKGD